MADILHWLEANKDGLASAGVVVGAVVGVLTAVGGAFAWLHKLRKSYSPVPPTTNPAAANTSGIFVGGNVGDGSTLSVSSGPSVEELAQAALHALEGKLPRSEADAQLLASKEAEIEDLRKAVRALAEEASRTSADKLRGVEDALAALALGKTAEAETVFRQILDREKAARGEAGKRAAQAARHLGALAFLHDTQAAVAAYRESVALDPRSADGWNQLGNLLVRVGDLGEAKRAYQHVLDLCRGDDAAMAVALGNLGVLAHARGDLEAADDLHKQALSINEQLGRKEGILEQLGNLGRIAHTRGDLDAATNLYERVRRLSEDVGRMDAVAMALGNLGVLARTRGDLDAAEALHRQALRINERLGRREGVASQAGNLGRIAQNRGDLSAAERLHKHALGISEALGHTEGVARELSGLGGVALARGDLDAAEDSYKRAHTCWKDLGNKEGMAVCLGNLGVIAKSRGDLDEAVGLHEGSLQLSQELGREEGVAAQLGNLGLIALTRGDLDAAE